MKAQNTSLKSRRDEMFIATDRRKRASSVGAKCTGCGRVEDRAGRKIERAAHSTPTEFRSSAPSHYKHPTPAEFGIGAIRPKKKLLWLRSKAARDFLFFAFSLFLFSSVPAFAQGWAQTPPPLSGDDPAAVKVRMLESVGIDQRLGEQLPLDLTFRDESGATVRIGDYFGKRPVVLALVYYTCPMLCNQVLNGLTSALDVVSFSVGKEFEVVTVSFDPRDTSEVARNKKEAYLQWYKRPGAAEGWHFLTGDRAAIDALTQAAGFHFKFDPATNQFIHASGIMIATSEGKLARYFYGIEYAPKDLRLGLVEASDNHIGTPVDRLLLYCYHYDPSAGKYGAVAMNILRLASVATLVGIVLMLFLFRRRLARANPGGAV